MLRIFFVQIYHKNNHNNIELIYIALIEISKQIASKWWASFQVNTGSRQFILYRSQFPCKFRHNPLLLQASLDKFWIKHLPTNRKQLFMDFPTEPKFGLEPGQQNLFTLPG